MAKKFVKVTGLNKVFDTIDTSGNATIKSGVSAADSNSILFIEATTDDSSKFSSPYNVAGSRWIWAQGKLYDANTPLFQKLTNLDDSSNDSININDSVELILRKLKYQVEAASKAGVQSLTSSTDNWITVDPKLDASTGAVNLSIGHADASSVSTSIAADISIVENFDYNFNFKIPQINVDSKGHFVVDTNSSTTTTSITLDACTTSIVHFKHENNKLSATIATADYTAYKKGDTAGNRTLTADNSSFIIIDLSTDEYGFARKSNEAKITLPHTAFADTTYEFAGGTQSFTYKVKGSTDDSTTVSVSHMGKGSGSVTASDGKYISDVCIDNYGHVIGVASNTNGVYSDDAALHAAGALAVWDGKTNKLKTSDKTIRSGIISVDSSTTTIPTTAQVIDYVNTNKVSGAMSYKGTFDNSEKLPSDASVGDTYVLNASTKIGEVSCQVGDMFIYNDSSKWDRIPAGDTTVEVKNTLITDEEKELAVIDGVSIKAKVNAASTTQKGIVQLSDSTNSSVSSTAATSKAVYDVSEAAHKVKFDGSIKSTSDGSYILGSFTNAAGTTTTIYGQDTKYVHPAVSSSLKAANASNGGASTKTVITSVYIDASGHVGKVETSDITAAYNKRAVKVNGTSLIESSAETALNISAGTNVTLTTNASEGSVTIAASDEKVKSTTIGSSSTGYLLATTTNGESTETAVKNASVTINGAGKLSAVSLYEGAWSIHDSSAGDWATIE